MFMPTLGLGGASSVLVSFYTAVTGIGLVVTTSGGLEGSTPGAV